MAIIKFWNGTEWHPIYLKAINNRLEKSKNLSDLTDVDQARKNLGLSEGNVETHYHDTRYYTKDNLIEPELYPNIIHANAIKQTDGKSFASKEEKEFWNQKIDTATVSTTAPNRNLYNGLIWYNPSTTDTKLYLNGEFRDVGAGKSAFGIGSFAGNGSERAIAHNLKSIPVGISVMPISNPGGFLGETWVRADDSNIYIGNTGSFVGQFRYSIVYS